MNRDVRVVILAGGLGTRIRARFPDLPKPLIPIHGRSFLEWQLESLISQGLRDVLLCVSYRGEQIQARIGDGAALGARVVYASEATPLERRSSARPSPHSPLRVDCAVYACRRDSSTWAPPRATTSSALQGAMRAERPTALPHQPRVGGEAGGPLEELLGGRPVAELRGQEPELARDERVLGIGGERLAEQAQRPSRVAGRAPGARLAAEAEGAAPGGGEGEVGELLAQAPVVLLGRAVLAQLFGDHRRPEARHRTLGVVGQHLAQLRGLAQAPVEEPGGDQELGVGHREVAVRPGLGEEQALRLPAGAATEQELRERGARRAERRVEGDRAAHPPTRLTHLGMMSADRVAVLGLRALASLLKRLTSAGAQHTALARDVDDILSAPRLLAPLKRPKRYVISAALAA